MAILWMVIQPVIWSSLASSLARPYSRCQEAALLGHGAVLGPWIEGFIVIYVDLF